MSKRQGGSRCCFASCGVSSSKCRGLSFHKLPAAGVSKEQDEWRAKLIHLASRKDKLFNPNTAMICSRHFTPDCFVSVGEGTIRHLRKGAIPTQWLEQSSITTPKPPVRQTKNSRLCGGKSSVNMTTSQLLERQTEKSSHVEERPSVTMAATEHSEHAAENSIHYGKQSTVSMTTAAEPPESRAEKSGTYRGSSSEIVTVKYYNLEDLRRSLHKEVQPPWCVVQNDEFIKVAFITEGAVKLELTIVTDNHSPTNLIASVKVLGIPSPHVSTLQQKKLKHFLNDLLGMPVCTGVTDGRLQKLAPFPDGASSRLCFRHVQYSVADSGIMSHTSCVRSRSCDLLDTVNFLPLKSGAKDIFQCKNCQNVEKVLSTRRLKKEAKSLNLKPNDPLHGLTKKQFKEAFKNQRSENKELKKFKEQMKTQAVELSDDMHSGLLKIVTEDKIDNPLKQLFWEEQMKAFQRKGQGMRWHPMMIRLAIHLHSKSAAAYELLRTTGVLRLPGTSTLQEYAYADRPSEGFNIYVQEDLKKAADRLPGNKRFVALLHDEMCIKSDLVYDKRSGQLVGFVKQKGSENCSFNTDHVDSLATHALVFYLVGINSDLKTSLGFFGTKSATAHELYPLFWRAVEFVEEVGLKVVVSTSDKASANLKFYQMHGNVNEICYKTLNTFADEDRYIYFISDPPHLVKTVRNNLASSGSGRNTKFLWNNGQHLLWRHIIDLYRKDQDNGLMRLPRLTHDHLYLTAHSVMNVKLAAQVLSFTVGSVMCQYGDNDSKETAKFIMLMDRFFDCMNTRHLGEANRTLKPDLSPYADVNDARFGFLQDTFLQYLEDWRVSVQTRAGQYSKSERQKMFLTHQTYKGLYMTVHAFVQLTKYLLQNGVDFVLSNRFCQDPIEQHFGRHRWMGKTNDNPNLYQFGYHEHRLRMQRELSLMITPKGNVRAGKRPNVPCTISTSPLKKQKKE